MEVKINVNNCERNEKVYVVVFTVPNGQGLMTIF